MNSQITQSQQTDIFTDVFRFPWIPFKEPDKSAYNLIGSQSSVLRLSGLAIANGIAILIGLIVIIDDNPYIPLSNDLHYPPFLVAFVFMTFISFLANTVAHFLCFRAMAGKANLTEHGYITALSSTSFVLLYWLAIITLLITRARGIDSLILILGGLYLLYPSLVALKTIHNISVGRLFAALVLSVIVSIPLYILHLYLFVLIREARPYEIYDWRSMALLSGILLIAFFILALMIWQQRYAGLFPESVPIQESIKEMLRARWVQLTLSALLISLVVFLVLDFQYPSLKTKLAPYSIAFLPAFAPDTMYVYTKAEEFGDGPFVIEVWDLSIQQRLDAAPAPEGQVLRPNEDEHTLIISDYRGNHVVDPQDMKSVGQTVFLPIHGTYNPIRNEFYRISPFGKLVINRGPEKVEIDYEKIIGSQDILYTVAVHPNGQFLFLTADNRIYILDANSLEVVNTIRLGGKLRDLAVSPDGKMLYIADALWHRVRIVPSLLP